MLKSLLRLGINYQIRAMYKVSDQHPCLDFAIPELKVGFVISGVDLSLFPEWLILKVVQL